MRGAGALTAPRSAPILSGMKVFFVALSIAVTLAGPALAQSTAEWRAVASPRDISLIENWAAMLRVGVERAGRLPPADLRKTDIENIEALLVSRSLEEMPPAARGSRVCRVFELDSRLATLGDDHVCRFFRSGASWRLLKSTGEIRFLVTFFSDPVLGVVFLGDWWTDAERGSRRWTGPDRRAVGVLRMQSPTRLLLHLPEDHGLRVVQIDLPYRPVIDRPPGR